jgi:two-component system invasion response regulator UvrY
MNRSPQILIFEDHDIVANAISLILNDMFSNAAVTAVSSFQMGLKTLQSGIIADLIILDINLPGGESYQMVQRLRTIQADVRILIFSEKNESQHAMRFLKAGANGFLSKSESVAEINVAVNTVMADEKYMSDFVKLQITEGYLGVTSPKIQFGDTLLSKREKEVLALLMEGKWTREISQELNVKQNTVSSHKSRIFEKFKVTNILQLFRKANPRD